jgi:cardiolipin synthase
MRKIEFKSLKKINLHMFKQLPDAQKRMTLSSYITLTRIVLSPLLVSMMIRGSWGFACGLFTIAASTDMIDGTLARIRDEKTFLGACLDPIADKILILSCFFTLAFFQSPLFAIPQWFVWAMLLKELLQITGAVALYCYKGYLEVEPTILGKITTIAQMGFICWLFACYFLEWVPLKTYYSMIGLLLVLVCATFVQYAYRGLRFLRT